MVGGLDVCTWTWTYVVKVNAKTTHEIIAMTGEEYLDLKNVKTEVKNIQQWKENLLLDEIVHGMKSGEILDPLKVEKGQPREFCVMDKHSMYELVKNADAHGGYVHAKWLQDHKGDEVRSRLVATQLATGERLDVTQSAPPLRVARLLLAIASLHVDENDARDWVRFLLRSITQP